MNRRSRRVGAMGSKPVRNTVGDFSSKKVMPTSMSPMQIKNTVVGKVHTIQSNMASSPLHAAHCKSLCNVVAHEPNDDGARNDGKRSGRRQRGPIHTRCRYGARHGDRKSTRLNSSH